MTAPPRALQTPKGWEGLLDPGEQILWQGGPVPGLTLQPFQPMRHVMGIFFAGFSLFWMSMASSITGKMDSGPVNFFPLFGLLFLGVGLWNAGLFAFWKAFVRSKTTYTLTNTRGFIATNVPLLGRKLKSYPIAPQAPLEYDGDEPGTIWFAERNLRTKNGSHRQTIGFERITGAREVYAILRKIQRDQA